MNNVLVADIYWKYHLLSFIVLYIALNANEIQANKMADKQKKQNRNFSLYELQSDANRSVKLLWHFPKILKQVFLKPIQNFLVNTSNVY